VSVQSPDARPRRVDKVIVDNDIVERFKLFEAW
jgi:hypothetical protein